MKVVLYANKCIGFQDPIIVKTTSFSYRAQLLKQMKQFVQRLNKMGQSSKAITVIIPFNKDYGEINYQPLHSF